jgi:hypothetical protein
MASSEYQLADFWVLTRSKLILLAGFYSLSNEMVANLEVLALVMQNRILT